MVKRFFFNGKKIIILTQLIPWTSHLTEQFLNFKVRKLAGLSRDFGKGLMKGQITKSFETYKSTI